MKMKEKIAKILGIFLAGLILISNNVSISHADEAFSEYKTFPKTSGYTYKARV